MVQRQILHSQKVLPVVASLDSEPMTVVSLGSGGFVPYIVPSVYFLFISSAEYLV